MTTLLILFLLFVLLGLAAARWGVDSRDPEYSLGAVAGSRRRVGPR